MRKATQVVLAEVLILVSSSIFGTVSAEVNVSGVVTDSTGSELSHAWVTALPRLDAENFGTVGNRPSPWIQADNHGGFSISLPPGRYKIQAKDETDGYSDPVFMLNDDPTANYPEILVKQQDILGLHITLGKRGGILEGRLLNDSGSPIQRGKITIRDAGNEAAYVEVFADEGGRFRFTVPSKPLRITASASGYKAAIATSSSELTLSEGEHRQIVLVLKRE